LSLVFVVCWVGSGLCDELITRPEESCNLCVFVSTCVWSRNFYNVAVSTELGFSAKENKNVLKALREQLSPFFFLWRCDPMRVMAY